MYVRYRYLMNGTHTLTMTTHVKDINQNRPFVQLPYQKKGLVFFHFQLENSAKALVWISVPII
jgi:hypothetical protein